MAIDGRSSGARPAGPGGNVAAPNGPDKFKTEKGAPLHSDILHAPLPAGPKGQHAYHTAFNHMVMKYSKNAKGAVEFLRWAHRKENYEKWFTVQKGFAVGPTKDWENHAMWKQVINAAGIKPE